MKVEEIEAKIEDLKKKIGEVEAKLHEKMMTDIEEYKLETDVMKKEVRRAKSGDLTKYLVGLKAELKDYEQQLSRAKGERPNSGIIVTRFDK